jgi:glycosyltransferase involved in cell wall biosynthesis
MPKIYIIIPVFNEAQRLDEEVFLAHLQKHPLQQILFVNDGSSDNTNEVIEKLRKSAHGQVHTLSLSVNQGKAEAIRSGILKIAEKKNDADFFGYIDADLATPLSQVQYIVDTLEASYSSQIALGSRVQMMGYDIQRKRSRHYLGRIFATYVSLLFGFKIYDTQCGAKFFRASENNFSLFKDKFTSRWFFDIEILLRFINLKNQETFQKEIIEVPLKKWHEQGNSKLKFTDFIFSPLELRKIKKRYR